MGSYATLTYGHFSMGEWKSHVPLSPLMLFTQEDYCEEPHETATNDEDEPLKSHKFVSTALSARQRCDSRGLTIATCERLFEEFKADAFWRYNSKTGREWQTQNRTTFTQYLSACKKVFKSHSNWYLLERDNSLSKRLRTIFSEEFFGDDVEYYFEDVYFHILLRAFLEIVPKTCTITLDISDLIWGQYLTVDGVPRVYDVFMETMLQRVRLNYELYGFVLEEDPSVERRLRERLSALSEDQFIEHVLLPLLDKMGFQRVRKVSFHGRNEFGSDILPFRYVTPLGTLEYYAVQAKAVPIHGTSARSGNAGELLSQTTQAFSVAFFDDLDNERKRIDKFIIATNQEITPDARHVIESGTEGERRIVFVDIDRIVVLVKQHGLVQYLLFTPLE